MMTKVLIVEDSPTQAAELEFLLNSHGFAVSVERDGVAGFARASREIFEVVLSDVVMPGMDGYELCRQLKASAKTAQVPVLLLTSLADPLDIVRGLECGADNFITKPYDADYLVGRINHLLENRNLRAGNRIKVGVELSLLGKRFVINSEKEQMVDLLISTFEEVLRSRHREFESRLAEESHRQSHRLLQSALDALSSHIAIVDGTGEIVAVNGAWRRMGDICGWPWPNSGVGKDYRDLFQAAYQADSSNVERAFSGIQQVRTGERQAFKLEYPGKVRDEPRWFALSATRFDGDGLALVAIEHSDITERRRAAEEVQRSERALREQSHILNSILDSMGEGVVVADQNGESLLVNRRAEEILGPELRSTAIPAWNTIFGASTPDHKVALLPEANPMLRALRGEATADADVFIRNLAVPSGVVLAVTGMPLRDASNTLNGGVVVLRDVTQQRRLEQELLQAQKMDAVGQLAGGVAHDFNNLLSVIKSYGELMFADFPESDSRRDDLREMLNAADRAAGLTRQLLAFSRRQVVHPCVLELNGIVSNIERMLGRVIGENIDLVTVLDPELWRLRGDTGQIEQVLVNLGVNARDAMPSGGKLTIETRNVVLEATHPTLHAGIHPGKFVLLTVTDTGTGMDAETQARIFEPFFTTKDVGKGTGLGLSTVYGIVQQSGGHIWVYSELGCGTTFKIYLPSVNAPPSVPPPPPSVVVGVQPTELVLLVEDEESVRQVAARILRGRGYRVLEANGVAAARAICAEHGASIDLMLTDVIMPELSGPELATELLGSWPGLRVLYMSGYSGAAIARQGTLPDGMAFLEKPFTPDSLSQKVRAVLDEEKA